MMDYILNGQAYGPVAQQIAGGLHPMAMKPWIGKDGYSYLNVYQGGDKWAEASWKAQRMFTNATLRRDEWIQLDQALLQISQTRLGGVQDLIDNNLVYRLGNPMGTTVLERHLSSDAFEATISMDGNVRSQGDRVDYKHTFLPIPIISVDFDISKRDLEASRALGNPLDTSSAVLAYRKVSQRIETLLFTNDPYTFGAKDSNARNTIYGYINHPDRNLVTLADYGAWDDPNSSTVGGDVVDSVIAMIAKSIAAKHYGPWHLYIPTAYQTALMRDYDTTTPGTTIYERIMKLEGIKKIQVVDTLPANNVVLVQMTPDVVQLVDGMAPQTVQWMENGQFVTKFKVMAIQVPDVKSDHAGNSGIVHMS